MLSNRKKAEYIFEQLNKRGANLGNISIFFIEEALDNLQYFLQGDKDETINLLSNTKSV